MYLEKIPHLGIRSLALSVVAFAGCQQLETTQNQTKELVTQAVCVEVEGPTQTLKMLKKVPTFEGVCQRIEDLKFRFNRDGYFIKTWKRYSTSPEGNREWKSYLGPEPGDISVEVSGYDLETEAIEEMLEMLAKQDAERAKALGHYFEQIQREAQVLHLIRRLYVAQREEGGEDYMHKAITNEIARFEMDFGEGSIDKLRYIYTRQVLGLESASLQVAEF